VDNYINTIKANIPNYIKDLKIFLCYDDRDKASYVNYDAKRIKELKRKPRDLRGIPCSFTEKSFTFNECIKSIEQGYNSGLGIVVNNDLIGLDFDNCIVGNKKIDKLGLDIPIIKKEVQDIINKLDNTYIEISQSGKGLHCILYSDVCIAREIKNNNIEIEIYANKNHFMRLSGNILNDNIGNKCNDILDKTDVMLDIYSKYFNLSDKNVDDKDIMVNKYDYSFRDADFKSQFNGLSNKWDIEDILNNMYKKDIFYYKLFNDTLTSEDIDNYNAKRVGRGLIDTSNSGKSVLLILNLMHYSYGDLDTIYEIFKMSKLYKSDYDRIKWRAKGLTKLDMIVNYCKSRYRNFKKDEFIKE